MKIQELIENLQTIQKNGATHVCTDHFGGMKLHTFRSEKSYRNSIISSEINYYIEDYDIYVKCEIVDYEFSDHWKDNELTFCVNLKPLEDVSTIPEDEQIDYFYNVHISNII